jgi:hypothetical protein
MPRDRFIASGINMHVIAVLLGDVARRIGRAHHLIGRAALA